MPEIWRSSLRRWVVACVLLLGAVPAAAVAIVVNTPDDSTSACSTTGVGTCSLRDAITFANQNPGADTINSSLGSPSQIVKPRSPLPAITDTAYLIGPLEIDGSLAGAAADGLTILAGGCSVVGYSIYGFAGNGIVIAGGSGSVVSDSRIGVDLSGSLLRGNGGAGVLVRGSSRNWIGYPDEIRNIIAGNGDGVRIEGTGADENNVFGNYIGLNFSQQAFGNRGSGVVVSSGSGTAIVDGAIINSGASGIVLGPGTTGGVVGGANIQLSVDGSKADGIVIDGSSNNLIGGAHYADGVILGANGGYGIRLVNGADGNLIIGAVVGYEYIDRAYPFPNALGGILIQDSSSNTIGGPTADGAYTETNYIGNNGGPGITVRGQSVGNTITQNSILTNTGIGIDLGGDGPTPNHAAVPSAGPNRFQNYPVLTTATTGRFQTHVEGILHSAPNGTFIVELFAGATCHAAPPGDFGDGNQFLVSLTVNTDGGGAGEFATSFVQLLPLGSVITATATDVDGNTSEFSECKDVILGEPGPRRPKTKVVSPR